MAGECGDMLVVFMGSRHRPLFLLLLPGDEQIPNRDVCLLPPIPQNLHTGGTCENGSALSDVTNTTPTDLLALEACRS